jgi:hypothetical protein
LQTRLTGLSAGQLGQLLQSGAGTALTETINLYDSKTNLSKRVERAAAGEKILIAKAAPPATTKPPEISSPLSTSPPLHLAQLTTRPSRLAGRAYKICRHATVPGRRRFFQRRQAPQ